MVTARATGSRAFALSLQEIYSMNVDGSDQVRLTAHSAADTGPAFSPDGSRVVFVSDRDGNPELYDSPTTIPARLTSSPGADLAPAYSPDGKLVGTHGGPGRDLCNGARGTDRGKRCERTISMP